MVLDETAVGYIKGVFINLLSLYTFVIPILLCLGMGGHLHQLDEIDDHRKLLAASWTVLLVITLLIPPVGWQKPHPYSDIPSKRA